MDRQKAAQFAKDALVKHGLKEWGVRLTTDANAPFLGMCMYKDKVIILNAHHVDIHPDDEIIDTIWHEVAHALCPNHGHDNVWMLKAREIGCTNTIPCSHLSLPPHIIDAIRSGNMIEMEVKEEIITHVIRTPTYKVTRLQDKCPICGKVAKEKFAVTSQNKNGDTIKLITLDCFHVITKIIPRGTPFETFISNNWKPEIAACPHIWNKNKCSVCGEFKLMEFQIKGAQFAETALAMQKGAGIFDDMGLGKTVQALAIIYFHHKKYTPTMYVTKSAITFQWFSQIIRWLGPTFMPQIIKTSRDSLLPGLKSYIIPYDLLRRFPQEKLHKLGIKCVILDECQQIKNPDSGRTQATRKLVSADPDCKVIPLSGTPWKNRGGEFFPVLNMMDPIKFYSYQAYLDTWVNFYYQGSQKKMGGIRNPEKFREYTASILIRREFNEVIADFPDINRTKLNMQMDLLNQSAYDDSESDFVAWYNDKVLSGEDDGVSGLEILAKLARMRHIAGLAKIPATLGFVEEFINETDRKLVIFVHHKDVGQIMHSILTGNDPSGDYKDLIAAIKENGVKIFKYTSELSDGERFTIQSQFNESPRAIMVASTLACGEGVDLQTCADCVMHERQWNPQNEDQAAPGRFRRIGQKSSVINITFTEAAGTVDEFLDSLVEQKRAQFHEVMNKGEMPTWNEGELGKQLAEMIIKKRGKKAA